MSDDRTLSEYLLDVADGAGDLSRFPRLLSHPSEVDSESARAARMMVSAFVDSKESFTGEDWPTVSPMLAALVSRLGSDLHQQLDWHITESLLPRIPKFVIRTLKLSELAGSSPSPRVAIYLREATTCYVFGLFQASVALSRAAMEQALKERITNVVDVSHTKLGSLVVVGLRMNVLDQVHGGMATSVQRRGNDLLHGQNVQPEEALDTLIEARAVLEYLLRAG